jgi:hypothetical protein
MCEFANLRMCGLNSPIRTSANSHIRKFANYNSRIQMFLYLTGLP